MTKTDGAIRFQKLIPHVLRLSRNYVATSKDLKKILACEQISHQRTPESPGRGCWRAKNSPPHHSCVWSIHGDCVPSRNAAIITTLLYAILAMVVLISLHWRDVSLEKNVNKSETCSNNGFIRWTYFCFRL